MHKNRYGHMVHEYTVGRVREILQERADKLAAIQTRAAAQAYVDDVRAKAARCFPALPARTDLNARTTGTSDLGEIRLEKIVYESRPGFLVSANLFLPAHFDAELPCVLGLCGHSENGKAYGPYQFFARGLASKGFAVLIVDPVSQGERRQFYAEEGVPEGESGPRSTVAHNMIGNRMLLTGDFIGSWFAWDAIRGLDYLLERPETDTSRVGVTGCSGGGTQTTQLTALDPRITMAAPDCFITSWLCNLENELPADAEQNPPRALAFGLDEADLLLAYAPRPTMILAEENCYFDLRGARQAHAEVKKIHTLLGSPDSAEISVGHLDHGFHKHAREAMYGFFIKHAGLDVECQEAPMEEIAETQLNAAEGEVVPFGSKKIFGFTQARAKELIAQRPLLEYSGLQEAVSRLLQIQAPDTPPHFRYLRRSGGQDAATGKGYQFAVESEPGIQVILTMFGDLENQCRRPRGPVSLYAGHLSSEEDCATLPWLQRSLSEGQRILAADLRGTGQSFPASCGSSDLLEPYGADYLYASFGSMMGESYLGRRVLDLIRTIDCLVDGGAEVHLIGRGVGSVPVALAALLHASQPTCELVHYLPSYQLLIDNPLHNWPLSTMVENCLKTFDLPDIYAALGARLQKCDPWGPWI
jgi:cephalosporin-C deacetylase-like acetyl esterase/pimeloyl-ACP methyl ester carboxylesterase